LPILFWQSSSANDSQIPPPCRALRKSSPPQLRKSESKQVFYSGIEHTRDFCLPQQVLRETSRFSVASPSAPLSLGIPIPAWTAHSLGDGSAPKPFRFSPLAKATNLAPRGTAERQAIGARRGKPGKGGPGGGKTSPESPPRAILFSWLFFEACVSLNWLGSWFPVGPAKSGRPRQTAERSWKRFPHSRGVATR
jgi:hypothetical protein